MLTGAFGGVLMINRGYFAIKSGRFDDGTVFSLPSLQMKNYVQKQGYMLSHLLHLVSLLPISRHLPFYKHVVYIVCAVCRWKTAHATSFHLNYMYQKTNAIEKQILPTAFFLHSKVSPYTTGKIKGRKGKHYRFHHL